MRLGAFGLIAMLVIGASFAAAQSYTIADLGTLGGSSSAGYAINASGQVTGYSLNAINHAHAFIISPPYASMTDLGSIGIADYSFGTAINASGQVTGGTYDVFVISAPYSSMTDLGSFGGVYATTGGYGINASGQITGWSFTTGNIASRAFLSSPPYSGLTDLGSLGGSFSGGSAINASGQITGSSATANDAARHPFVMSPPYNSMIDLGTLGGGLADGFAINDSGQVTGESTTASTTYHAFLISAPYGSNMADLGTLGGSYSAGLGINAPGRVVGTSYIAGDAAQHAFFYTPATGMVDLNTLLPSNSGWTLLSANSINDLGQITGYGVNPSGDQHAFLLTPPAGGSPTPAQMLTSLIATIQALSLPKLGTSLIDQLQIVQADIAANNGLACADLKAFANHVKAQTPKSITPAQAQQLLTAVASIESALNCGP